MASAFAEAGDHLTAEALMTEALQNLKQLLPESEKEGVRYHLTMKAGSLKHEIISYLREHRDVVLTIYDAHQRKGADTDFARKSGSVTREIQQALSTPLVVIRDP
jgi:predicted SpoU family rRNA methylase